VAELRVLVVYHTSEGQTARIAEHIAEVLRGDGISVDVRETESAPAPAGYDGVVVGDSIHLHHSRELVRYVSDHVEGLEALPSALFQVSMTSAKPDEAHVATAHALVNELIERTSFDPDVVGMFAGALAYTQYGWLKRHVMHRIEEREGLGDTDMSKELEFTDWAAVEEFARDFGSLVRRTEPPGSG
jgi:menaquinone-dependent protoporphyrinogen oxidase